ncbi:SDR family oxidoreductase [uncultured Devosia sp.]|uniref:SDR family oxidoreductase n=1 Tax=uncultured Devosia sp. TaxID=211434 RepID=UPI0035CB8EFE
MDLGTHDKHALVLGASQGLGLATAQALLTEGARVTLSGRSPERLEAVRAALPAVQRASCFIALADLAEADAAAVISARAQERGGPVDILVNNTCGLPPGKPSAITSEAMASYFSSMVTPVIALTLNLIAGMRMRGWGRVLTIASSGVVQLITHLPMSNALRSTLVGFMKSLSGEVAAAGVTINLVLPGRIATGRTRSIDAAQALTSGKSADEIAKAPTAIIPAGRYGTPEEFAAAVTFLASSQASYMAGGLVRIDGGAIRSV